MFDQSLLPHEMLPLRLMNHRYGLRCCSTRTARNNLSLTLFESKLCVLFQPCSNKSKPCMQQSQTNRYRLEDIAQQEKVPDGTLDSWVWPLCLTWWEEISDYFKWFSPFPVFRDNAHLPPTATHSHTHTYTKINVI